ncbi:hypothetical protein ACFYST_03495 [Kitasatospora sp. NPDC004614]|uniref:hypothetical protein n=1 Tax=unclassified Kitasatospora TaxID=2633591 RepID=UPI0036C48459
MPENEKRLRESIARLKKTTTHQEAELEELRRMVTQFTLAEAALTQAQETAAEHSVRPDNVVLLRPPTALAAPPIPTLGEAGQGEPRAQKRMLG